MFFLALYEMQRSGTSSILMVFSHLYLFEIVNGIRLHQLRVRVSLALGPVVPRLQSISLCTIRQCLEEGLRI